MGFREVLNGLLGRTVGIERVSLGPVFKSMVMGLTPEELYRSQPHLRTVLSFVARNVAHLGLQAFERVSDTDRKRVKGEPIAQLISLPNPDMTGYELLENLVGELLLYDTAYWIVAESTDAKSGWMIRPIPSSWVVEHRGGNAFSVGSYIVQLPNEHRRSEISAKDMIVFRGWNPGQPKQGASPVDTLKNVLAEQVQAWSYRQQVWARGGRVGTVITRPAGVAQWSDAARERFARDWKARWTGPDGEKAGGTPILEDGMTLSRVGFSAREDEWAEVSKLALSTVAGVYHVNPAMVGVLDNANYSNTKEFRKMLYSETLGPLLAMIEDRLNAFLVPRITDKNVYLEFNIAEKLQGDFEEQAVVLSQSVGAPWMTVNEARARQNLPALPDGDQRVIPLNVLVGGQANPHDSGEQNRRAGEIQVKAQGVKALMSESYEELSEQVLQKFFARQRDVVMSRIGAKSPDWWDSKRWDKELSDDLFKLAMTVTVTAATQLLTDLGLANVYESARTVNFLRAVSDSRSSMINSATMDQLKAVLAGNGPDGVTDPMHVFDIAMGARSESAATTLATTFVTFATVETGKQTGAARKTWLVMSGNPRPEHAVMNGETVGIDDVFSNGAKWPGDPVLGADGVAGCSCEVEVIF